MNNNKAFSLIELSIVLIIIGLLVAGITGGQSLIESAKIKAFMNEMDGYKQAVFAFKTVSKEKVAVCQKRQIAAFCFMKLRTDFARKSRAAVAKQRKSSRNHSIMEQFCPLF